MCNEQNKQEDEIQNCEPHKTRDISFSIIVYVDNYDVWDTLIISIQNNAAFHQGIVQVIAIDSLGDKDIRQPLGIDILNDWLIVLNQPGIDIPSSFNLSYPYISNNYVSFITTNCYYKPGALDNLVKGLKRHQESLICLNPAYINENGKQSNYLNFRGKYKKPFTVIDLEDPTKAQHFTLSFYCYFFEKKFLYPDCFDIRLPEDYGTKFLLTQLIRNPRYLLLKYSCVSYDAPESDYYNFPQQFSKSWYLASMRYLYCDIVQADSLPFLKYAVLYAIHCRFACNLNARDKEILSQEEIDEFFSLVGTALHNIDDEYIRNCNISGRHRLPNFANLNFYRLKYHDETLMPQLVRSSKNVLAVQGDMIIDSLNKEYIEIKVIYFDGTRLLMDGCFTGAYLFPTDSFEILAKVAGKFVEVRPTGTYDLNKFFNRSAKRNYTFQFCWESRNIKKAFGIKYYLKYKDVIYSLPVKFIRAQTKLTTRFSKSYWVFDNKILTFIKKTNSFMIAPLTKKKVFKREIALLLDFYKHGDETELRLKCIALRLAYWLTKPYFSRKRIWLTQDKIFKAGDNGEYFYRYVQQQKNPKIKIYYVVSKSSPDYVRLKKEFKTIVAFNSAFHRLLALHTDLFLATHVDVINCNGFYKKTQQYFKDLLNGRVVCLAHGLTIQKIAQYQNRVFDNTVLYFFASKYEVENVKHPAYDYYDDNMLQLTGHARYDGLISDEKKIILITPTWRRGITTGKASKGATYGYSKNFKNSDYFKIYNSLISDKRLLKIAQQYGYRIIYLLHPAMSPQLQDFSSNEVVSVIAATGDVSYEKILTESSLMVTDYSGVQFDFAYMQKPIIYYHPAVLPPQYEAGGLDYETMGFGPICVNHEEIIEQLCRNIENGCQMDELYRARVQDFFEYSDHNNCARIYEKVIEFQNQFEKVNKLF